jgi:hypothetical protein
LGGCRPIFQIFGVSAGLVGFGDAQAWVILPRFLQPELTTDDSVNGRFSQNGHSNAVV